MNEKITEKLIQWIDNISNFASDKLPEFAEEIIRYRSFDALFGTVVYFLAAVFFIICFIFLFKSELIKEEKYPHYNDGNGGVYFFLLILIIGSFIFSACDFLTYKKCELAPKLVILETLRKMT